MEDFRNKSPISSLKQQMYRAYGVMSNHNDSQHKSQVKKLLNMKKFYTNRQKDMIMFLGQSQKYKDTDFIKRFNADLLSNKLQFDRASKSPIGSIPESVVIRDSETAQTNSIIRPLDSGYRELRDLKSQANKNGAPTTLREVFDRSEANSSEQKSNKPIYTKKSEHYEKQLDH